MAPSPYDIGISIPVHVCDNDRDAGIRVEFELWLLHPLQIIRSAFLLPPTTRCHDVPAAVAIHVAESDSVAGNLLGQIVAVPRYASIR